MFRKTPSSSPWPAASALSSSRIKFWTILETGLSVPPLSRWSHVHLYRWGMMFVPILVRMDDVTREHGPLPCPQSSTALCVSLKAMSVESSHLSSAMTASMRRARSPSHSPPAARASRVRRITLSTRSASRCTRCTRETTRATLTPWSSVAAPPGDRENSTRPITTSSTTSLPIQSPLSAQQFSSAPRHSLAVLKSSSASMPTRGSSLSRARHKSGSSTLNSSIPSVLASLSNPPSARVILNTKWTASMGSRSKPCKTSTASRVLRRTSAKARTDEPATVDRTSSARQCAMVLDFGLWGGSSEPEGPEAQAASAATTSASSNARSTTLSEHGPRRSASFPSASRAREATSQEASATVEAVSCRCEIWALSKSQAWSTSASSSCFFSSCSS
mmetsp:Transcript_1396/g.4898  ORF Transcript_1396/g.4898 Transcript_1396/m.4898 type:complete len:390 (-) Transcript_1396:1092-2261(-)